MRSWPNLLNLVSTSNSDLKLVYHLSCMFCFLLGVQGLEASCQRSATTFSLADYPSWLRQLHCAYSYDLEERLSALQSVQYTSECMGHVCGVWEREVAGGRGVLPKGSRMIWLR